MVLIAIVIMTSFSRTAEGLDPHSSYPQYLSQLWTMSNGFPGGRINAITQTADGYLWIGTSKGLFRFDGFTFVPADSLDHVTAPVSQALSLVSAKDGALWVGDQDMNVRRYLHGRIDDTWSLAAGESGAVSAIARSSEGDVLVATQGPRLFLYSHGRNEALSGNGNLGIPSPQTVDQTSDGKVWMATYESGLFYWDRGRVTALKEEVPEKINCLFPVENGGLWIGTDEGVVLWDGHKISTRISSQAIRGARVLSLAEDRDRNVWIGSSNGLFRLNSEGVRVMEDAPQGSNRTITAIFEDREGNLWVGDAQGIERLRDGLFTTFSLGVESASEGAAAGPIYADGLNRTWVAPSHGGLYCVVNGEGTQIQSGGLGRDVIYSIAGFENDLWVGRREGGLTHLVQLGGARPAVREVETYTHSQGLAQDTVSSVFRSSDGTIWAGTLSGGVSKLRNGKFTTLTSADGLGSNTISSIQEDSNGVMWFGTSDGLSWFESGKMKSFRARDGLPSDEITTLLLDSSNVLWVGTSQGLAYLSLGQIHPILDARPALHEPIFGITEDRKGYVWLTSSNHIFRINRSALLKDAINDGDYREFGESDGLRGTEGVRRDRSAIADSEGRVWLSTLRGLSLVNGISPSAAPAPPHVEYILSDGQRIDPYGVVRIRPDPQRITITYEAVSLAVPNRVQYRYKLEGFDHVWSDPTESRQVVYTNLGPGSYRFGLQTSQGDNVWKGSDSVLSFVIQPTLWQTWWFRSLWITVAGALLVVFYRVRVRIIARAMSVRFDERLDERTRMARELHDTFLQTVQGSKIVAEDALATGTDEVRMRIALEKLSGWLGQAVSEGRAALHALRVSTTEQNELAEFLDGTLKEHCRGSSLSVALSVVGGPRALHPIVRDEISLIAKEAIRNACLHSRASHLRVELGYADDLILWFKDNGVGIDPDILAKGKAGHFGLQGMKERGARIRAKITVLSTRNVGTELMLRVPGGIAYKHERRAFGGRLFTFFKGLLHR